jgi:hypothetical protein
MPGQRSSSVRTRRRGPRLRRRAESVRRACRRRSWTRRLPTDGEGEQQTYSRRILGFLINLLRGLVLLPSVAPPGSPAPRFQARDRSTMSDFNFKKTDTVQDAEKAASVTSAEAGRGYGIASAGDSSLKRQLKDRHVAMISIGGSSTHTPVFSSPSR